MDWSPLAFTRSWAAGLLITLLMMTGCAPLPDDEAAWVLEDLATREGESRLKEGTPHPVRRPVVYAMQGRTYQGDLYQPAQPPLAALVPGVAERGTDDPRLVAFATTLARARYLVLVPDLPTLRAHRVQAEDARGVADAFLHLLSRPEFPVGGRAGIGAFSYAVGPAVLAALEPGIRERVDFVLGVGGYYDLHRVVTFFTTGYFEKEGRWHYLEPNRLSGGYTDMHVHCVPRDGAVSFRSWRRLVAPVLARSAGTHGSGPQAARAYMDRLAELGLPLLCHTHTGAELVLPAQRQAWGDLVRLHPAMDAGVTVIAAHGGSSGWFYNQHTLRRYAALLASYPNLYGDTAALGLVNHMGVLLWWRRHAESVGQLLFGTDYPVPVTVAAWQPWLEATDYRRLSREANPFDRMVLLLEALGIHPPLHGFEALLRRSGRVAEA